MTRRPPPPPPPPSPPPLLALPALLALALALGRGVGLARAQGTYGGDNRCFLESGGSAESFFVSEDMPVGAVIGTLRIIGDPSERGNIALRLQERDSPAAIVPGTKNISLTRRLDKEGVEGPSSVYINVICDRRRTADPGFVIPVNIRVTDANDNAPQFLNAPYVLTISEVTVVGTRVLQGVKAVDADQQGPFSTVHYSVLPGPHSDYFVFVNELEGTLLLRKPLDYEKLSNFTLTIRAQDQGVPPQHSDTTLQVNVMDADDQNPRFYDERYTALLPEPPVQGARLRVRPREIAAYDQDVGINAPVLYSFNSVGPDYRLFEIDRAKGHVLLRRAVGDAELLTPATLVLRATQADNPDRYALATLTVERAAPPPAAAAPGGAGAASGRAGAGPGAGAGASGAQLPPNALLPAAPPAPRFLQRVFTARALESLPPGSRLLTALTNRPHDKRLSFWLDDEVYSETFGVSPSGEITLLQPLDFEAQEQFSFAVHVGDAAGRNDSARVEVQVLDVNDWDPRFRYPQYEFQMAAATARRGALVGRVEAADGDRGGDRLHLELRGPDASLFAINDAGEITLVEDPATLKANAAHMVAVATDSGLPPREASVPVVVRFAEGAAAERAGAGWAGAGAPAPLLLLAVFGALLGALALVVLLLLLYIYRHKRRKGRGEDASAGRGFLDAERSADDKDKDKVDNPIFAGGAGDDAAAAAYTATVKSIIARTTVGGGGGGGGGGGSTKHKMAPAPPQLPAASEGEEDEEAASGGGGGGDSIPRRVKKLSWDDEAPASAAAAAAAAGAAVAAGAGGSPSGATRRRHPAQPELDPALSVTPLVTEAMGDQSNLTVYF